MKSRFDIINDRMRENKGKYFPIAKVGNRLKKKKRAKKWVSSLIVWVPSINPHYSPKVS